MSRSSEYMKTRAKIDKAVERRFETFKCNGCVWGKWTGKSYVCLLPRCIKKLGSFKR